MLLSSEEAVVLLLLPLLFLDCATEADRRASFQLIILRDGACGSRPGGRDRPAEN